ncbi:MAG: DUF4942 domain-containing protein [Candidatus Thiodiazotropha lotti]|nr:DUF4942 domain-containing protein [Candidatus Thiodiazotropha lotti]
MDKQYYPTPADLGRRAWAKFQNRTFVRVLEPQAGKGDLAVLRPTDYPYGDGVPLDCIEIDIAHHATLREKGFDVVGIDFLDYQGPGSLYSHVIMNPPFNRGTEHLLKAWNLLFEGEIVAILNAETVRNPFSKERKQLVRLIEQHGSVEFIENAFSVAEHKTDVEIALVYLRKKSQFNVDLAGNLMEGLKRDTTSHDDLVEGFEENSPLALPGEYVRNTVKAFNAAVQASKEAIMAEARNRYYVNLLGDTMERRQGKVPQEKKTDAGMEWVRRQLEENYRELKNRAWAGILRSTEVAAKLSSAAQRRLEADFESIKTLEFTAANIYGFLLGLSSNQGQIQLEMACDCFDLITRYHTENTVHYKGWKSNDKHRTCGMRIKTSRFILPGHSTESYHSRVPWETERLLADFDKVFALLDSKKKPEVSLINVFFNHLPDLRDGERISSSYFDVRYYPKAGTIHFFARDKQLINRLNLLVGRHRQWLPPQDIRVSEAFWLQYDKAEKFDKAVRKAVEQDTSRWWNSPLSQLHSKDGAVREEAESKLNEALDTVLLKHGIDPTTLLDAPEEKLPLLSACC